MWSSTTLHVAMLQRWCKYKYWITEAGMKHSNKQTSNYTTKSAGLIVDMRIGTWKTKLYCGICYIQKICIDLFDAERSFPTKPKHTMDHPGEDSDGSPIPTPANVISWDAAFEVAP